MKRFYLLFCLCLLGAQTSVQVQENLWQHRNLGKAFYENPTTQMQAVEEFRRALQIAPSSVRDRLNFGLALLRAGKTQEGIAELERVQKQDPSLPHTWFNLGITFRKNGEFERAIAQLEKMTELAPSEPVSRYNLGVLYRQAGRLADAQKQLESAERLDAEMEAPHFQLYNLYRQSGRVQEAARELAIFQRLKKEHEGAAIPQDPEWSAYAEIYDPIDMQSSQRRAEGRRIPLAPGLTGQLLLDLDGSGKADVLAWSRQGLVVRRDGEVVKNTGLENVKDVISAAAGDFDNDGLADLCVLSESGPALYRNVRGKFQKFEANLPAGRFEKAVWLDYDHDYDLDLLLLGDKPVLLRNQGTAGFADHTRDFPFVAGHAVDAVSYRWIADSKAFDLLVTYSDHSGILYSDKLTGKYEAVPISELPAGAKWLESSDVNGDGWLDIISSLGTLINHDGKFERAREPIADGSVAGDGPGTSKWIRVALTGVKNLKLGYAAEIEVKAGASYQKKPYQGVPLLFDLNGRNEADTVRITWPNGLIQNETKQAANHSYNYKEAQRLSGSCPMIWTWDGKEFRFITDVLGIAPLGATSGDGKYFPVDHDEYIQIPADALAVQDGKYEIRVTEELSEVSYLDQVELAAMDYPATVEVFTNEKWKAPPYPDFRLFGVSHRVYPKSARDGKDRDVLPSLLTRDRHYVDTFQRNRNGVAELHTLTMDFGAEAETLKKPVLILSGWVDWADGSTFLAAAQESREGLIPLYLQVRDEQGNWKTVISDMGMPDGKPKTIAVDLRGKFLSPSREVRIVTNLCVYWDEIFLGDDSGAGQIRLNPVVADSAELRFRGFSAVKTDPDRTQPEEFIYADVHQVSSWNPTPGMYTRYGGVRELLGGVDDRFAILGSGDEVRLKFSADSLPKLRPGWRRSFLLKVDGWAKDRDANTAYSQSVEPLPFHAMSAYPYSSSESYPPDAVHDRYRQEYNTRPALRLMRPLVEETGTK